MPIPQLIAHRGYASRYPENTLSGVEAAIRSGAACVEVDVQLSADGVPLVIHDANLQRTAGIDLEVLATPWARLEEVSVHEPERLGQRFLGVHLPRLAELVELLAGFPTVTAFIEIKEESLAAFGVEETVTRVMEVLAPCAGRCPIISFAAEALEAARRHGAVAVGWVVRRWEAAAQAQAGELAPDYLFCNHTKLPPPPTPLWPGPWRWALYEVDEVDLALSLAERGADYIETMAVGDLLLDPRLLPREGG